MNLIERIDKLGEEVEGHGGFPDGYHEALDDVKEVVREYQDQVNEAISKRLKVIGDARFELSRHVLDRVVATGTLPEIVKEVIEHHSQFKQELSEEQNHVCECDCDDEDLL